MKKSILFIACIAIFFSIRILHGDCCDDEIRRTCLYAKNLWQPRSFSSYGLREITMLKDLYDHHYKHESWDGTISLAVEFMQSFKNFCKPLSLGAMPFWSGTNTMSYGNNDGTANLDAYQFGLGDVATQGKISLHPKVQHFGTDILLHFTRYKHDRGPFFKIKAPLAVVIVDPQLSERHAIFSGANDDAWKFYPTSLGRYNSMSDAFAGGSSSANSVISSLHKPFALESGRISCCKLTSVKLGDLTAIIGYNVYGKEHCHLGFGFKLTCPTGTVPEGKFILEPIVGRAGHWGIGLDITSHYKYWINEDNATAINFWMQSELTHLAAGRRPSWRSFDLQKNGPGSKYLLLQFYFPGNPTSDNSTGRVPSFITQAVNVTTLPVISTFKLEGSFASAAEFSKHNWNLGIGVEVWGRTAECLSFDTCNLINQKAANLNDFAVLGRQISEDARFEPDAFSLNLCEPCAKINKSEDRVLAIGIPPGGKTVPPAIPPAGEGSGPIAPTSESSTTQDGSIFQPGYDDTKIKDARLYKNRIPEKLTDALDIQGAAEGRSVSGKISISGGYTWTKLHYCPSVNLFAGFEVTSFDSLHLNLWSVGIHGALNF